MTWRHKFSLLLIHSRSDNNQSGSFGNYLSNKYRYRRQADREIKCANIFKNFKYYARNAFSWCNTSIGLNFHAYFSGVVLIMQFRFIYEVIKSQFVYKTVIHRQNRQLEVPCFPFININTIFRKLKLQESFTVIGDRKNEGLKFRSVANQRVKRGYKSINFSYLCNDSVDVFKACVYP